jgi:hypothetical protein
MVDVAGDASGANPRRPRRRVDPHPPNGRQVDDEAIVDAGQARSVVAAPANGDRQFVVAAEVHCGHHVGRVGAARDQQRPFVDHGVVEFASLFIFGVIAPDQRAPKALAEFGDTLVVHGFAPKELVGKHLGL